MLVVDEVLPERVEYETIRFSQVDSDTRLDLHDRDIDFETFRLRFSPGDELIRETHPGNRASDSLDLGGELSTDHHLLAMAL